MALETTVPAATQPRRPKKRKRGKTPSADAKAAKSTKTLSPVSTTSPGENATPPVPSPAIAVAPASKDKIAELEAELERGGVRSANVLLELLAAIKPGSADATRAIHASRRALARLSKAVAVDGALGEWVEARRLEFGAALARLIRSADADADAAESAVAVSAVAGGAAWTDVVSAALRAPSGRAADVVGECFVARFSDLRVGALDIVAAGAGAPARRLALLKHCAAPAPEASVRSGVDFPPRRAVRRAFSAAWTALLLDKRMPRSELCAALAALPDAIPALANPLDVADFLKGCYSGAADPEVAIAALDPLFVLISKHGLDYPLFYHKLYALLTPRILFHSERNARFLHMAAMFLRFGEFLPGGIIAAFVKRLARRALVAPPAGAMWCLRLALDLLHKHPNVSFLVHRAISLFDAPAKDGAKRAAEPLPYVGADPFDDSEIDPQASRAEESSLWELEPLRNHISPAVSRLVLAFSKDVRKRPLPPPGDVADYAALSFEDVFEAEFKRKAKNAPIAYDAPGEAPGVKEVIEDIGGSICWR